MSSQFYSEWRTTLHPSGFAWRGHARPTGETCPSGEDGLVQQLRPRHANTASRRMTPESFASLDAPSLERAQGRPGAGWHPRSAVRKLREDRCTAAYRAARTSRPFPAQWFDGLWRALPGERCTIAPVALRMADARARSGRFTTASLDAQTPGVRTTRFCRTLMAPVVCATASLTVARPAKLFAPMQSASTAARPACRDDRDTAPLPWAGLRRHIRRFRISVKWNISAGAS